MLLGSRSTIRLPTTLPIRTIAKVVMILRIILVAVPLFNRVEPVSNSGPIFGLMTTSGLFSRGMVIVGLKQSRAVFAPCFLAAQMPPQTNGVRPLAAMPRNTSRFPTPRKRTASAPASATFSPPISLGEIESSPVEIEISLGEIVSSPGEIVSSLLGVSISAAVSAASW